MHVRKSHLLYCGTMETPRALLWILLLHRQHSRRLGGVSVLTLCIIHMTLIHTRVLFDGQ
jgi:hypothetical protein